MRRRSRFLACCFSLLAIAGVAACGGGASTTAASSAAQAAVTSATTTPAPTPAATPTPVPTPTPAPTPPPLAAPLMVQVENAPDARPQSGLGEADVVYEYETEGGISRFTTLWFNPPSVQVGPVRSARLATIKLVHTWDGTLVYSGSTDYVLGKLASSGDRYYNETTSQGALFRIGSRFAPHNLYTDGSHLTALANRVHAAPTSYQLWARTPLTALPNGGTSASTATVGISNFESPRFTWNAGLGGYTRSEPTGQLVDAATGKPWTVPTIVILQVPVTVAPEVEDVSGTHGLDFAIQGSGPAQVLMGGFSFTGTFNQGDSGLMRQGNAVHTS
jgi:hypothetical protein